ncbi:MAG: hypothetical protein K8W52_23145 [Deltaproteobacteria bacterium]|nr:hypothetical protein [Deltaproteobacteria bacterium]
MTTARELRTASTRLLRQHIVDGYPVDPQALEGWVYRGTSLGLPRIVEKLTWKNFQKTFYREPGTGKLIGWNVRLEQDGIDAPSRPKLRRGQPVTEWHYEVIEPAGVPMPKGFDRGLVIDYGRGRVPDLSMRFVKDPLVSLSPNSADELIGVSYVALGGVCVETPTYFTLVREQRITDVPYERRAPTIAALRLTSVEREWAEMLFAAIVATTGDSGLPPFASTDRSGFWLSFDGAAAPLVRAGLRPMLHTLVFLPVVSGFRRPFFRLSPDEQVRFLTAAASDQRYFVRQAMTTLKTLACFAYFDDPTVRARFAPGSAP